jgi:hypothetical protein
MFAGGSERTEIDVFNTTTQQWVFESLSEGRSLLGSATLGHLAFFGGGQTELPNGGLGTSSRVDIWNIRTRQWTTETLSVPRRGLLATAVGNQVLFIGLIFVLLETDVMNVRKQ